MHQSWLSSSNACQWIKTPVSCLIFYVWYQYKTGHHFQAVHWQASEFIACWSWQKIVLLIIFDFHWFDRASVLLQHDYSHAALNAYQTAIASVQFSGAT